jgi:hypothetical protein
MSDTSSTFCLRLHYWARHYLLLALIRRRQVTAGTQAHHTRIVLDRVLRTDNLRPCALASACRHGSHELPLQCVCGRARARAVTTGSFFCGPAAETRCNPRRGKSAAFHYRGTSLALADLRAFQRAETSSIVMFASFAGRECARRVQPQRQLRRAQAAAAAPIRRGAAAVQVLYRSAPLAPCFHTRATQATDT